MASTQLTRSISSTGNRKTATFSAWVKKCDPTKDTQVLINFGGTYSIYLHQAGLRWNDGSGNFWYTNAVQRDTSGFYHIVIAIDTTQATASDRVKGYINGEQITSLLNSTYPSQNADLNMNVASTTNYIGNDNSGTGYFDGIMSHVHWIDGTAYDATAFGETDANGVWTIKTSPSVTYGTNGFFILKDGNSVTDQSGNSNNFTVGGGTLTNTEDCPDNVFATFNPLGALSTPPTFSNGNTTAAIPNSGGIFRSTLAASSGKWYCEVKANSMNALAIGVQPIDEAYNQEVFSNTSAVVLYNTDGTIYKNGSNIGSIASVSDNDIIGIALDLDNNNVYFSKNGQYASGLSGAWNQTFSNAYAIALNSGHTYTIASQNGGSGTSSNISINFGNGYFGTTAVASAGTNASGIGIFEYDVPTGYTALSTKGLNL